jgi:hypothetical protein
MAIEIESVHQMDGKTVIRVLADVMNLDVIEEIRKKVPAIIAEQYVREHYADIVSKLDLTGLANLAAVHVSKNIAELNAPEKK